MNKLVYIVAGAVLSGGISANAVAQEPALKRPGDTRPDVEKQIETPEQKPQLTLPPIEELPETAPVPGLLKIKLSGFEFEGNTVYSDADLQALLKDFLNRYITTAELEQIRLKVTNQYINNGYINSGALIPDQDLKNDILKIKIVEGHLTTINLQNDGRLNKDYLTGRISPDRQRPLNIGDLQERLYLLQQNPRIKRINAALGPGAKRGDGVLDIHVAEENPYSLTVEFNNYRPVSVGEKQGELHFNDLNLSGAGDTLDVIYDGTQGLNAGDIMYAYPVAPNDAVIKVETNYTESNVVQDEFKDLDISSKAWSASLGVAYPFQLSRFGSYVAELKLDRRYSESLLSDSPLSCGYSDGKCNVTALRLSQTALWHNNTDVVSFRQVLSMGLHAWHASIYKGQDIPPGQTEDRYTADGRFTAWLLQFQWAKRYSPLKLQSIFRTDMQLAFDPLLSMEQFAVGGAYSVRGYRENQYVSDNGLVSSLEFRYPVYHTARQEVQVMTFYDYGQSWNYNERMQQHVLSSVGLGLRYTFTDWVTAQMYWGEKIKDAQNDTSAWQDKGFHVSIRVNAL